MKQTSLRDYQLVFDSPEGQRVLCDLMSLAAFFASDDVPDRIRYYRDLVRMLLVHAGEAGRSAINTYLLETQQIIGEMNESVDR